MADHRNEVRVGLTLVLAAIVLVVGMLWLGGVSLRDDAYELGIVFDEVAGLNPTDKVRVAGLEAGEVVRLGLSNGRVLVDIEVDRDIRIPVDSGFSVAAYGFLGAKHIAVSPGTSRVYFEPGEVTRGGYERGLNDVVNEMGETLAEIRRLLRAADEVISDIEGKERVKRTLENASAATGDLRLTVADLKVTAAELRSFVVEKRDVASSTIDSMEVASRSFTEAARNLQTVAASLDSIVARVEGGEGTVGRLVNDPEAYDEFVAAIKEVRALVARIEENPKSFVRFSIF